MTKHIALCSSGPSIVKYGTEEARCADGPIGPHPKHFDDVVAVNFAACAFPTGYQGVDCDWYVAGDALCYTEKEWIYHRPSKGYVCLHKTAEMADYQDVSIPDLIQRVDGRDKNSFQVVDWKALAGPAAFSFVKAFGLVLDRLSSPGDKLWVFGCDWTNEPNINGMHHGWTDRRERREKKQVASMIERLNAKGVDVFRLKTCPLLWERFTVV